VSHTDQWERGPASSFIYPKGFTSQTKGWLVGGGSPNFFIFSIDKTQRVFKSAFLQQAALSKPNRKIVGENT
jgi:hypothetical protein